METIQEIFGPPRRVGNVGIEIEVEGRNIPKEVIDVWVPHPDGSLRGEAMEYVTRLPVAINLVMDKVQLLKNAFIAQGGEAFEAHRGSIHIHYNMQQKTLNELFGVLFAWTMVEGYWMRKCGPTREANLFCLPGSYTGDTADWCRKMFECVRKGSYHNFPPRGKYASLNTDPITKYGSIEFRTFATSIEPEVVNKYAQWCHNLVTYGCGIDLNNLTKEWQKVRDNPAAFLKAIFGEDIVIGEIERAFIDQGCEQASELVLVYANHKVSTKIKNDVNQAQKPARENIADEFARLGQPMPLARGRIGRNGLARWAIRLNEEL